MRDSSVPSTDTHIATSLQYSGGSPVLRILSARPSRRKISIERAETWLHFTFGGSPARRVSVTGTSTPREARFIASVSPPRPAPTTRTLVSNERSIINDLAGCPLSVAFLLAGCEHPRRRNAALSET